MTQSGRARRGTREGWGRGSVAMNFVAAGTIQQEIRADGKVIETEKKLSDKEAAAEYEAHRRRMELPEFRNSHNEGVYKSLAEQLEENEKLLDEEAAANFDGYFGPKKVDDEEMEHYKEIRDKEEARAREIREKAAVELDEFKKAKKSLNITVEYETEPAPTVELPAPVEKKKREGPAVKIAVKRRAAGQ